MPKESISGAEQKVELRESSLDYSILPTDEESLFLHQNDYWIIRYHGRSALLKSTRGLQCLAVLLRDPGREFHVGELLGHPIKASTPAAAVAADGHVTVRLDAGMTVLDAQAKAEYKCRLHELRQDLHDAERFNDPVHWAEVQSEINVITNHLAFALGFGGRDRKTSSDAERARSAVTKCIRKAIKRIGDAIPPLGYHLSARIKTGYFCSYSPHPERHINWKF
jgi:non-specific serine/threonine protein kinase